MEIHTQLSLWWTTEMTGPVNSKHQYAWWANKKLSNSSPVLYTKAVLSIEPSRDSEANST